MSFKGKKEKLIYGIGINDSNYVTQKFEYVDEILPSGKKKKKLVWICPFYKRWKDILVRCYSKREHKRHPTYKDCYVCGEWLKFSNFRSWMISQDWEGKALDKDILFQGNKEYSPEKCVFVDKLVNGFLTDSGNKRGSFLIGVSWDKKARKFRASCKNPFSKKQETTGRFTSETEAHFSWKKRKHEIALALADSEYVTDERVAESLRNRYKNYNVLEDYIK